ncbi:MAG: hypothetical protein ABSH25_13090 [Syntrophorhabdales bacterium]
MAVQARTAPLRRCGGYEASTRSDEVLSVVRDERIAHAFLDEAELMLRTFRIGRA